MTFVLGILHALNRFAYSTALPTDTEKDRLRKAILVYMVLMTTPCGIIWGGFYIAVGYPQLGMIPIVYSVICILSLTHFMVYKNYVIFGYVQLLAILLLPACVQWAAGGFVAASAVIVWSFLSSVGALVLFGASNGRLWFVAFCILLIFLTLLDTELQQHAVTLPGLFETVFFFMNLIGPLVVSYLILLYFTMERDEAQELSERLLLNVLPYPIAERLKRNPEMIADEFHSVSILFADIANFTPLSEKITATELVNILGDIFTEIDRIADRYGIEKIKTIGDSYMAVAGLPYPREDHAEAIARMALDMRNNLESHPLCKQHNLVFRIGINTGSVVAGVIGEKKFIYDLWGDAVNTASRMESHGEPGAIQVTRETYEKLKDQFEFQSRGTIFVKGKGEMETFLLKGSLTSQ